MDWLQANLFFLVPAVVIGAVFIIALLVAFIELVTGTIVGDWLGPKKRSSSR